MSTKIEAPRGVNDILPADIWKWQTVERIARDTAARYHFEEIRTPIFEHTELFHRGVGETSDIVHKETYTFDDRGNRSITLRPEGTAGVVRAAIENSLIAQEGARSKVYYIGPNFRYEKPQSGRLRIHHQFGVEAFGVAEPEQDVECILLQMDFYSACGLRDLSLNVNSLGDAESKQRYRDLLVAFLEPNKSKLSDDSQRRLTENPLRILDSKDPRDVECCVGAPPASQSLSDSSRKHFDRVLELLNESAVAYSVNANLVRGFDYYTETLWEVTAGGLGSQNAVGGGGRYDKLVELLGGKPTPGVGFGSGLERLLIALEKQGVELPRENRPLIWLINQSDAASATNFSLMRKLRKAGYSCDMDLSHRSMKAQLKMANREKTTFCLFVGEEELAANSVMFKNFTTGQQQRVATADLIAHLASAVG